MSKLKAKDPKAAEPSKPKILIFGKPGVGKTWGALDFPSCYYIDTEGGANLPHYTDKLLKSGGVYLGPEDGALDFKTVIEQVKILATTKHPYRTVIIDSISELYNTAIADKQAELSEKHGDKSLFGAEKKPAIAAMKQLLSWAKRCDLNVLLIAHSKAEWGNDGKGERIEIGQTFDAWDKIEYALHLAMEITKQGPSRKAKVRKSRLIGFPDGDSFPWSYEDFSERYGKSVIEAAVKAIVLASPEQVSEIERLLEIVKVSEDDIEKWKAKADAETFSEFTQEQASGIISHLTNKINPTKN